MLSPAEAAKEDRTIDAELVKNGLPEELRTCMTPRLRAEVRQPGGLRNADPALLDCLERGIGLDWLREQTIAAAKQQVPASEAKAAEPVLDCLAQGIIRAATPERIARDRRASDDPSSFDSVFRSMQLEIASRCRSLVP